ncbi:MAG: hypothetical protein AAF791_04545 [Bacteroidota bacterium]
MRALAVLLALTSLSGCSGPLIDMFPESGTGTASVTGLEDPLERVVRVSTADYFRQGGLLPDRPEPSLFAVIAKGDPAAPGVRLDTLDFLDSASGPAVSYQIVVSAYANEWRFWDRVRYVSGGGELIQRSADRIASDVSCSSGAECLHLEVISAPVPRVDLEALASSDTVTVRLANPSIHADALLTGAEVRAFLDAVDRSRAALQSAGSE